MIASMELGDILSPIASLVVGFFGAVLGVRQSNAAWKRDKNEKRILALRNYQRALYDMAAYLEGVEISDLRGHPKPKDLDATRQAAFPYFEEFGKKDYLRLVAPNPGPHSSAMEDSDEYFRISNIIKNKLDEEASARKKPLLGARILRRSLGAPPDEPAATHLPAEKQH
jgi:hypothetical protein